MTLLVAMVNTPNAKTDEELAPVTDNAISAISKICITHPTVVAEHLDQLLMLIVSNLPLETDLDEAVIVHDHLMHYLSTYEATRTATSFGLASKDEWC
jgi:hypothetical protein